MLKSSDLTICIPAFNESEAIADTLSKLVARLPGAEIIVVDDGSTDSTADIARKIDGIKVLKHGRNIGYGASIKTAIKNSSRNFVAWYDADGQHNPDDLVKVANKIMSEDYDVVIGIRDKKSDRVITRMPGKFIIKMLAQIVAGVKISDLNSGMRCFKKEIISRYLHLLPSGFSASTTTTLLMLKRGYSIGCETITTKKRAGTSSVRMFRDGWKTIQLIVRILILFEAFNFFSILALIQFIPAMAYGLCLAYVNKLGFPVFAATFVISSILTFFMGIICDQIVSIRMEKLEK